MPPTVMATLHRLLCNQFVQLITILLLGSIAYSNTLHVPFVLDDLPAIVDNRDVENLTTFLNSGPFNNARWFAFATFAFNRGIGGIDVTGYHLLNLIIHLIAGIILFFLAKTALRSLGANAVQRYAFAPVLAALAFVLHPVQTQAVTYVVQRMTSLAALLYLGAVLLYAQACAEKIPEDNPRTTGRPLLYCAAIISALLAMSTKEISFTLPFVLALYDFCFLEGNVRRRVLRLLPFFLAMVIMAFFLVGLEHGKDVFSHGGGDDISYPLPHLTYLITELSVLCTYLRLLVLPVGQNLDYDYPVYTTLLHPRSAAAFILVSALLAGGVYLLKKSFSCGSKTPGLHRITGFAVCWFFITISVESGLVPLIDRIFEHRVYLPSAWFFIAFGVLVCELYHHTATCRNVVIAFLLVLLMLSGYATYQRNLVWRDNMTLWNDVVQKSPLKVRGWTSLGILYVKNLDPARAKPLLEYAVALNPEYYHAHAWLGLALMQLGDHERALYHYRITTRLAPKFSKGWELAGRLLLEKGLAGEARYYLGHAQELDPEGFASQDQLQVAVNLDSQARSETRTGNGKK